MITLSAFKKLLVRHGIVHEAAFEDPEGYDGFVTNDNVNKVYDAILFSVRENPKTEINHKSKLVLHHDDPPCQAKLREDGYCEFCKLHPDMQSTCFHSYCEFCNVELVKMRCPVCNKKYKGSEL